MLGAGRNEAEIVEAAGMPMAEIIYRAAITCIPRGDEH